MAGRPTKSRWTEFKNAVNAAPLADARIPFSAAPFTTDLTADINYCTPAQLVAAGAGGGFAQSLYLPTASNLVNMDAATPNSSTQFLRLGSMVLVFGQITLDATAPGVFSVDLTLPTAAPSVFGAITDASGSAGGSLDEACVIHAVIAGGIQLQGTAVAATAQLWGFSFAYRVLP